MEFLSPIAERLLRIPPFLWMLGALGLTALIAIFVFSVSVGTVANYSLLVLFWGGHMFMHGSRHGHGSHDSHQEQNPQNASERTANKSSSGTNANDPKEHSSHSGGCH